MNQHERKLIRGTLEVRAVVDSQMGISDDYVPKDTIGYVQGHRIEDQTYVIFWPTLERKYRGDWRMGSHSCADVAPTGRRG